MILKSDKEKLTLRDAAKMLGVCKRTVQLAITSGRLEAVRGGIFQRVRYVTRKSVDAILAERKKAM